MKPRNSWLLVFLILVLPGSLGAVEITGAVDQVIGQSATVVTDGDLLPSVGDKVEIFIKPAGADYEISVGSGQVTEVDANSVLAKIDNATGTVAKNQRARITSDNPKPKPARPTASPSVSASASPTPALVESSAPPRRGKLLYADKVYNKAEKPQKLASKEPRGLGKPWCVLNLKVRDFYQEAYFRIGNLPAGSFGFIFRLARKADNDPNSTAFSTVTINPDKMLLGMDGWKEGKHGADDEERIQEKRPIPAGLFDPSGRNCLGVEVSGSAIRVFLNGKFAASFVNDLVTAQGLCGQIIATGKDYEECTVYSDSMRIYKLASSPDRTESEGR